LSSLDLLREESIPFLLGGSSEVREMSSIDIQHPAADSIRCWAEDLDILLGVVGNSSLVLFVVCITVQSDTDNFGLEVWWELGDGIENDSSSLTIFIVLVYNADNSKLI
jgi:hypothetical protein